MNKFYSYCRNKIIPILGMKEPGVFKFEGTGQKVKFVWRDGTLVDGVIVGVPDAAFVLVHDGVGENLVAFKDLRPV